MQKTIKLTPKSPGSLNFNESQKAVINSNEKELVIQAGPGTGKSATLLGIVDKNIKDGLNPSDIQMITFTRSGVKNLKDRLKNIGGRDVGVSTFHSYALNIIKTNKNFFKDRLNPIDDLDLFREGDDIEKDKLRFISSDFESLYRLKNVYDELYHSMEGTKTSNRLYYILPIRKEIQSLKLQGISPDELPEIIERKYADAVSKENTRIGKNGKPLKPRSSELESIEKRYNRQKDLAKIYDLYEKTLKTDKKIDFDDIIHLATDFLENNNSIKKPKLLLVDEYQDTNKSQEKLIDLIKGEYVRYVGDEKQAIFQFQGASSDHILNAAKNKKVLPLQDNYRSNSAILDFADKSYQTGLNLLGEEYDEARELYKKVIPANKEDTGLVKMVKFQNPHTENFYICEKIKDFINKGENLSEIAVIFRNNAHGEEIARLLHENNIPYDFSLSASPFKVDGKSKIIIELMKNIYEDKMPSSLSLYNSILPYAKVEEVEKFFYNIKGKIPLNGTLQSTFETILNLFKEEDLKKYESVLFTLNKILEIQKVFQKNKSISELPELIEPLFNEEYIGDEFLSKEKFQKEFTLLKKFVKELELGAFNGEKGGVIGKLKFAADIEYPLSSEFTNSEDINNEKSQKIQLLTAHKSKGLEFKTVFIAKNDDLVWNPRKRGSLFFESEKEEVADLNLFYVAATRAKENLYLMRSKDLAHPYIPESMVDSTVEVEEIKEPDVKTPRFRDYYKIWGEKFVSGNGISYSSLNRYNLSRDEFRLQTILSVRDQNTVNIVWGNFIHKTLNLIHSHPKIQDDELKNDLKALVDSNFDNTISNLTNADKEAIIKRYNDILPVIRTLPRVDFSELKITDGLISVKDSDFYENNSEFINKNILRGVKINGTIDDLTYDKTNNVLRIGDYKTGTPKTEAEVMKKGEYEYRGMVYQLYFYKLLLQNSDIFNLLETMGVNKDTTYEGVFDFIRDDGVEEIVIPLMDESIEKGLKEDIIEAANSIADGRLN